MEGGSEERGTSRYEDRVTANCSRHDQQGEPIHRWRLEGNGMPKKVLGFSGGITARVHVAWECSCGRGAGGDTEEAGQCRTRPSLCGAGKLVPKGTSRAGWHSGHRRDEHVAEVVEVGSHLVF